MVLVSSMAHAGAQLWDFQKPFNEKDWEEANGDWKFRKGIYQEVSGGEAAMHRIARGADWEKWEDYTVSCKIRIDGTAANGPGWFFVRKKIIMNITSTIWMYRIIKVSSGCIW